MFLNKILLPTTGTGEFRDSTTAQRNRLVADLLAANVACEAAVTGKTHLSCIFPGNYPKLPGIYPVPPILTRDGVKCNE